MRRTAAHAAACTAARAPAGGAPATTCLAPPLRRPAESPASATPQLGRRLPPPAWPSAPAARHTSGMRSGRSTREGHAPRVSETSSWYASSNSSPGAEAAAALWCACSAGAAAAATSCRSSKTTTCSAW
eukprot:350180-Chlamydomonas_euryale.AAC.2